MKLILITGVLGSLMVGLCGLVVAGAVGDMRSAHRASAINEVADLLLGAAGAWAVERGTTNTILGNPSIANDAALKRGSCVRLCRARGRVRDVIEIAEFATIMTVE